MSAAASGAETFTGRPSIHTVLRPSLRRTYPVTAGLSLVGAADRGASGSPRRSRSSRARSSGVLKSVPNSTPCAAVAARAVAAAASARLARAVATLLLEGDPFERAIGFDARLQR